jgi:hypothetical protein
VVQSGSGRGVYRADLVIGGKTGTAQNPHGEDHSWFSAYAGLPGEPPGLALAVFVENGGHGSTAAVPIAKEMIDAFYPVPPGSSDLLPMNPEIVPRFFRVGESTGSHKVLARLGLELVGRGDGFGGDGILFIFSATLQGGHASSYMVRQGLGLAVGLVAMVFLGALALSGVSNLRQGGLWIQRGPWLIFTLLFGTRLRGSRSWIDLGSFYFQPVEITRLALAVALAAYANARSRDLLHWRGSVPPLLLAGVHFGLVLLQPDLSSALVMGPMTLAILFAAGMPLGFLVTLMASWF